MLGSTTLNILQNRSATRRRFLAPARGAGILPDAGKAAELGLVHKQDADLNDYVTAKALDGLFSRIADEERTIRKDPLGQANSLIKKVFGAVR